MNSQFTKGFQKVIYIERSNPNYQIFKNLEYHLKRMNKDLLWLMEATDLPISCYYTYLKGTEDFSINSINEICKTINQNGGKIISPKQLLPPDITEKDIRLTPPIIHNNIRYLMTITNTKLREIELETGLEDSVLSRPIRNLGGTNFKTYRLIFRFFKVVKKVDLYSPLDLIFFPEWGEKDYSYLELRSLIKRNFRVSNNTNEKISRTKEKFKHTSLITVDQPFSKR